METIEIVLLVIGCAIFIASFILPEKKETLDPDAIKNYRETIQGLIKKEVEQLQSQIEDTVEESLTFGVEKTERAVERLSNEKIMAVSDYSETVLSDINKAHQEVLFLYDILKDKQAVMDQTMEQFVAFQKNINTKDKTGDISIVDEPETVLTEKTEHKEAKKDSQTEQKEEVPRKSSKANKDTGLGEQTEKAKTRKKTTQKTKVEPEFSAHSHEGINNNELILKLHQQGKSNMAIAKELGLGIGEVKLVIDLYEGA